MRKGKWIQGTAPSEPVSAAAREALRARLRAVAYYLPLAAHKSDRDVEYVHQLRVSTRRAMAAVRIFAGLVKKRKAKWLERQLKKIRRAANDAREFDVLGRRIATLVEARPSPPRTALLSRIERSRDRAQKPVLKIERKLRRKDFTARIDKIVKGIRWRGADSEPTFAAAAADCLRTMAEPFFQAAASDMGDLPALHGFRIAAKHLRYSMEVFAAAFDSEFRTGLYPAIEEVQTRLGDVNDHAAAIASFRGWLESWNDSLAIDALRELLKGEEDSLAAARDSFVRWWTPERATDLRRRFDQAMAAGAAAHGEKSA
ncbi:MAG: CHAD domain-containing protein [Planctomycetia bacterium]|nr:CHAD domain-containing protein [Planctomycetia bacterium]